ncbi:MAG TPA: glycosyltransferase family 39 protein [Candidatus Krumholzibacteria bacterium]|nr:glycosyltransferase family 39 protein [Candidatus Krumholzibacteria bacterium]
MTPDRRTLFALFSFAFGLRVLYAVLFGGNPDVIAIHETYAYRIAAQMAAGWDWLKAPFSPNAPGYLLALSTIFRVTGPSWWAAVLFNATLGAITTGFLYRIGEKRLAPRVGLLSGLWLGAFVSQMHFSSLALREVLTTFLLVWLAYTLVRPFDRMRSAVWTGILYLALVQTEPSFLLLLPLLVVFLGLRATHHRTMNAQYLFLFVATVFVLNTPWMVRNYIVHRAFIPISLEATRYTNPMTQLFQSEPERAGLPEGATVRPKPGFLRNEIEYWRFARFADAPAIPGRGVKEQPAWSLRHNTAAILNFGILLPFFVAGGVIAWRRRHRAALVLTCIVLSHAILRGFVGSGEGTRLPVEPLVILIAFYGLRQLLEMRRAAGGSG